MESEISSIEKRFAYGFLQKLLKWMEIAQEFIAHLGTVGQNQTNKQTKNVLHIKDLCCFRNYIKSRFLKPL